ncbi:MAG: hypothetical protein RR766_04095 [Longicatena sp.]
MKFYFYNKNADDNGFHEIHIKGCKHSPYSRNQEPIGYFYSCKEAINHARRLNPTLKFDGCKYCNISCHKY